MCPRTTLECVLLGILDYTTRVTLTKRPMSFQVMSGMEEAATSKSLKEAWDNITLILRAIGHMATLRGEGQNEAKGERLDYYT